MKTLKLVLTSVTMFTVLVGGDESRIGTSGGNQVLVPVGARGIALAGSERVYSSGLESVYWNPAGLARSQSPTVLASSMDLFNDMGVNYFGASGTFDKLGMLGVTVKSIDMGDIPVTTVEEVLKVSLTEKLKSIDWDFSDYENNDNLKSEKSSEVELPN